MPLTNKDKQQALRKRRADSCVEHGWFKSVPDSTGEYHCMYYPSNENVRGSFKATTATIY